MIKLILLCDRIFCDLYFRYGERGFMKFILLFLMLSGVHGSDLSERDVDVKNGRVAMLEVDGIIEGAGTRKKKLMARQDSKTLKKIEDLLPHKDENLDATHTSLEETKDPLAFSKSMSQVEPAEIDLDKIDWEQAALFSSPWIVNMRDSISKSTC